MLGREQGGVTEEGAAIAPSSWAHQLGSHGGVVFKLYGRWKVSLFLQTPDGHILEFNFIEYATPNWVLNWEVSTNTPLNNKGSGEVEHLNHPR